MSSERHLAVVPETEYSIKEVLTLLQEEFPEVTISKIRFLESQGLITPERTPSGYRRFYERDIVRLREILRLQKSTYMPLKKIKEHLETGSLPADLFADDAVAAPGATASTEAGVAQSPAAPVPAQQGTLLTEAEARARTGAADATVRAALEHGLVGGVTRGRERFFPAEDVAVLEILAKLAPHGIEPRHLRFVRSFAERHAGLVHQVLAPRLQGSPRQREEARQLAVELSALLQTLGNLLADQQVRDLGGPAPQPSDQS